MLLPPLWAADARQAAEEAYIASEVLLKGSPEPFWSPELRVIRESVPLSFSLVLALSEFTLMSSDMILSSRDTSYFDDALSTQIAQAVLPCYGSR